MVAIRRVFRGGRHHKLIEAPIAGASIFNSGPTRARTWDHLIMSQVL